MEGKGGGENGVFGKVGKAEGHGYRWEQEEERLVRNVVRGEEELVCRYEGCGKVCRNKAGLVMHEKKIHRVNEERRRLKCERCGRGFDAEGQRVSNVRSCTGGAYGGREIGGSAGDVRGG